VIAEELVNSFDNESNNVVADVICKPLPCTQGLGTSKIRTAGRLCHPRPQPPLNYLGAFQGKSLG
jgi:hypothetical protein